MKVRVEMLLLQINGHDIGKYAVAIRFFAELRHVFMARSSFTGPCKRRIYRLGGRGTKQMPFLARTRSLYKQDYSCYRESVVLSDFSL